MNNVSSILITYTAKTEFKTLCLMQWTFYDLKMLQRLALKSYVLEAKFEPVCRWVMARNGMKLYN